MNLGPLIPVATIFVLLDVVFIVYELRRKSPGKVATSVSRTYGPPAFPR
jgi:hypothetical protein